MARPLRVNYPGAWYHVTSRGQEQRAIFRDDRDRKHFLEVLEATVDRFGIRLHAYALMTNHDHLIIETPEANLSRAMQWLNVSYGVWFNRRHGRVGHLLQGRFKAIVLEHAGWGLELSVYVHLNPVRVAGLGLGKRERRAETAGMGVAPSREVVARRLEVLRGYRWSSYRAYAGYAKAPPWLERRTLLSRAGNGESAYRALAEGRLKQGRAESPWAEMKAGIALGTRAFVERVKKGVVIGRETAGKRLMRRRVTFDEVRHAVESVKGQTWAEFAQRHADSGRALVYKAAQEYAGLTLREIGAAAGGADYAAVGMAIRRLDQRREWDKALSRQWRRVVAALQPRA